MVSVNFGITPFVHASMILREFPNLSWLKQQAEQSFSDRRAWDGRPLPRGGWPTVILNVETRQTYRNNIRGPLSLFTNITGESTVETGSKRVRIKENFFYVSNQAQHYTLEINDLNPTQTFNIHFGEYFADQVFQSLTKSPSELLENKFEVPLEGMAFHNTLHHRHTFLDRILRDIHSQKDPSALWLEEKLQTLLTELLKEETKLQKTQQYLPVLKSSTRQEIFKRLLHATDFIYAYFDQDISLDDLASISCLSKFHFLRLFKIAFQKTPHQFITEVRIRRSQELLKHTTLEVKAIAKSVGFFDSSSFSRAFHQHVGVYPTHFKP
jgi:AraC family transcriptional regulator